jgi:PAS domain S-box-containing protein
MNNPQLHPKSSPQKPGYDPHVRLFIAIIITIFLAEVVAMGVIFFMPPLPYYQTTLIDAGIMVSLIFPFLYLLSVRPLVNQIEMRRQAESELRQAYDEMELRVQDRTQELRIANTELEEEILERKKAEEQLLYQATLLANVNDAIIASDAQFRLTAWNSAAEAMYGWKAEEVLGNNELEIIKTVWPDAGAEEMRRTVAETGRWRGEATQQRKDGSRFPVEVSSIVLYEADGRVAGYVSVNRDITERKQHEATLSRIRLDLHRAQEVGQIGSWRLDVRKNELTWSDEMYRIFGVSAGTPMTYESFLTLIHPEDRDFVNDRWTVALQGEPYDVEHRIVAGGEIKWVREKAYLEFDQEGALLGGFGTTQDISQRKEIEDALRRAHDELELRVRDRTQELETVNRDLIYEIRERQEIERQLRVETTALESAANGVVITDRRGHIRWTNPAFLAMTGYTPEELLGQPMNLLSSGQQDRVFYRELWETILAGDVWRGEIANRRKDGSLYTEEQTITPVRNETGEIANFIAIKQDVTERKRAEDALKLERTRLRRILDTLPDGVYIVDDDFNVEYTNPVIEKEFGPVGGRKCYSYFHGRSDICEWCRNPEVFSGKSARWEWYSQHTDRTYDVFDTPLTNSNGSLSKLKLIHDISARKQVQAELEGRNLELQALSASEHKQRQVAETLRGAAQALTQSLDLDTVLSTLIKLLRAITQADTASVIFPEGEAQLGIRSVEGYEQWTDPNLILSVKIENTNRLYQRLLATRRSLLIPETEEDPDWVVYPGTEPIHCRVFVPVMVEDNLIGIVGLGKFERDYFTGEHIQLAEALVGQAAIAIQNAWLFEQVRAGRERLQSLSRRLVEIQESERRFIARELHDHAGQTLTSLMLGLGTMEKESEKPDFIRSRAAELKKMTDHVLEDIHRIAVNLRPASLDHLGLTAAVEQFIKSFIQDTHIPIRFKTIGFNEDERMPYDFETTLFRIVQEALTNVVRHAGATRVDVVLERRDDSMLVIVEDNGKGFDPTLARVSDHLGLLGMEERAEMLGGTLTVESQPGRGTTLFVEVPYADTNIARG